MVYWEDFISEKDLYLWFFFLVVLMHLSLSWYSWNCKYSPQAYTVNAKLWRHYVFISMEISLEVNKVIITVTLSFRTHADAHFFSKLLLVLVLLKISLSTQFEKNQLSELFLLLWLFCNFFVASWKGMKVRWVKEEEGRQNGRGRDESLFKLKHSSNNIHHYFHFIIYSDIISRIFLIIFSRDISSGFSQSFEALSAASFLRDITFRVFLLSTWDWFAASLPSLLETLLAALFLSAGALF